MPGGYARGLGGWFRIRMMVVARPVIFWIRATLNPAAAASRTASSRPTASQLRRLSSAALSGSGGRPIYVLLPGIAVCDIPCQPSPDALLAEDGPRRPWQEPRPGWSLPAPHQCFAEAQDPGPGRDRLYPGEPGTAAAPDRRRRRVRAPASPHLSGRGPHV